MHRIILEEIFLLFTNTKIKKVIKWEDKEKIRQIRTVHWVRNVSTKCLAFNCHFWEFRYIHLILLFYHRWVNLRRYFDFDLLPTKVVKSLPWEENLNFPLITLIKLFNFSTEGSDLAHFIGYGTKVKIPSKIKPPLSTCSF